MQSWHPITKFVASLGLLGLVIAWWTSDSPPGDNVLTAVRAESAQPEAPPVIDEPPPPGLPPGDRALAPVSAFEAMLSRPLFMPDRRPAEAELSLASVPMPAMEPAPTNEAPAPDILFIGSVEDNGTIRALISDGMNVSALKVGESVDGWEVVDVGPRRLVLAQADHTLEMTILE